MKTCLLVAILCSMSMYLVAQESDSSSPKSNFKAGLSYLSNGVYNGRKDSLPVPYLITSLKYEHKSGVYLDASMATLISYYDKRIDMFTVGAGYSFKIGEELEGSMEATKYFFNESSVSVKSALSAIFGTNLSWSPGNICSINGGVDYMITSGGPADWILYPGVSKYIQFSEDSHYSINPGISMFAGTRNYHDQYISSRSSKSGTLHTRKKEVVIHKYINNTTITTTQDISMVNPGKMEILDYEFTIPLNYENDRWSVYFNPTYAVPVNPATYITEETTTTVINNTLISSTHNTSYSKEGISNSFFFELGASVKF